MSGKLQGQTAWVGGGASGMGESTVKRFAAEGANVAIIDVQVERGHRVEDAVRKAGGKAIFVETDVSKADAVERAVNKVVQTFGGLQIQVNCAGIAQFKPVHEFTESDWDRMISVNLKSMFLCAKYAIPHLRKNKRSYIVNIGSISSFIGDQGESIYSATKGGVLMLTKSIALEYAADGMRCNCICPGIVDTPMLRFHLSHMPDPDAHLAERLRRVPMGVSVMPDDIAKCALYLSCEDSSAITGTSIIIDGGLLAAAEWKSPEKTAFMDDPGKP
jgi:NAD(P)-dependent dehydrogenase (short-subunit alcohol dehydrogenase family)